MTERFYTTFEVADTCRVAVETVREWIKDGKLAGVKRGRQYLVAESDLVEYLKEKHG
jgi:excisionase family DNA binding protein